MTKLYLAALGSWLIFSGAILSLAGWANIGDGAMLTGLLLIALRPVLLALGAWWYPAAEQDAERIIKLETKGK